MSKCKVCGKTIYDYLTIAVIETEPYVKEAMEKLKDKTCRELYEEFLTAISFFYKEGAKRLLLERGHSLDEFVRVGALPKEVLE